MMLGKVQSSQEKLNMQLFKLALISIIALFCVVTGIGLLFPSSIRVSRAVNISAAPDSIYNYINDISFWKLWMEGVKDSNIDFANGKTNGEGAVAKMGTNEITMTHSAIDTISLIWKTQNGKTQTSGFELVPDSLKKTTRVQWYFLQQLKWYPWERFGAMANDKILGPSMDSSLNNLKRLLEFK